MVLGDKCTSLITGTLRYMAVSIVRNGVIAINFFRNVSGFLSATGK
jgi:hypothetical protein